jgi:hypothetical protein
MKSIGRSGCLKMQGRGQVICDTAVTGLLFVNICRGDIEDFKQSHDNVCILVRLLCQPGE